MVVAISDARVAPITEDLTTDSLRMQVTRGFETMQRTDYALAAADTALLSGEWAVINSEGKAAAPGATPVGHTYPVLAGTDRFDVKATGQVTLVTSWPIRFKTSNYNAGGSYTPGDLLTVKAANELVEAATGEVVLARVVTVGSGWLEVETLGGTSKAP